MASELSDEQRLALFLDSIDKHNWGVSDKPVAAPSEDPPPESEEGVAQQDTSIWPTIDTPIEEEELIPEEPQPESMQLQDEFLKKNGYNWWNPPPDKIKVKGYRPAQNKPQPKLGTISNVDLTLDPRCGEPAPREFKFTPFAAICKFPYKFVSKEWSQPFATAIFDDSKIQNRAWDLYLVKSNIEPSPCVFVTEAQFQALIDEINESFPDAHISISQHLKDEGLVVDFSGIEDPALRPRWLGHSTSRAQTEEWPMMAEPSISKHAADSTHRDVELFKQKMDAAFEIARNKKKATKKARQEVQVQKRHAMVKELERAQKYLGLAPTTSETSLPDIANLSIGPVDPNRPACHAFDKEPIFIAIDVEAYERPPNPITEVGVATLDTHDLKGVAPGLNGKGWQGALRARHFRIAEYMHLVNKDFVKGCPDQFEFGKSEVIGKDKIASKLTSCFHAPFSADHMVDRKMLASEGNDVKRDMPEEKRNIIFLGHDVDNDIAYLRKLGFDPLNRGNLLETMDTRALFQAYARSPNPTSLGNIMYHFDLAAWGAHNAGNDAVHTVWALLAVAVAAAAEGKEGAAQRVQGGLVERESAAVEEARERVRDGAEGWVNGEEVGGGVKVGGGGEGWEQWKGSVTGNYTPNGYPLD